MGMWLQSFMVALTAQGLGSCVMVSTAGYEGIVKETLNIDGELEVLCGVAVGYEDKAQRINEIRSGRVAWKECVVEVESLS